MKHVSWPSFLLIGAHKAGTTALFDVIGQHPDVFVSEHKEPRFFALEADPLDYRGPNDPAAKAPFANEKAYTTLFAGSAGFKAAGEASTLYLYDPRAPVNIARRCPGIKLIAVLRDPLDRAYSNFVYNRRDGREPENTFEDALDAEDARVAAGWGPLWHYRRKGLYGEQIARYRSLFTPEQLLILYYEDWVANPTGVASTVFGFLGVDGGYPVRVDRKRNVSGVPRSTSLQRALKGKNPIKSMLRSIIPSRFKREVADMIGRVNNRPAQPLTVHSRRVLAHLFADDLMRLEGLVERPLPDWTTRVLARGQYGE